MKPTKKPAAAKAYEQTEREYPQLHQALGAYRQDQLSLRRGQQAQQLAALVKQ